MNSVIEKILRYVKEEYGTEPDCPWQRTPDAKVLRHSDNRKWYGLIFSATRKQLGIGDTDQLVDILNVKCDSMLAASLRSQPGILPGYHMNHVEWTTLLLDGTVPVEMIFNLLDMSYGLTASKKKKQKIRPAKEWIVPANPKYYDIEHAFDNKTVIDWKQSSSVKAGDVVYLYVAAPISAILYKCKVTETDIPYDYHSKELTISRLMKLQLLQRYDADRFTFERLKRDYGIYAVRGPRGVPGSLSRDLEL